jgi:hypothetical protein
MDLQPAKIQQKQARSDSCHSGSLACIAAPRVIHGRWLDDVYFAERFRIAKPVCPEWAGVHERVTFQE